MVAVRRRVVDPVRLRCFECVFLSWVIPINNDPVRQHDGSCSQTSHAKHAPVSETMF